MRNENLVSGLEGFMLPVAMMDAEKTGTSIVGKLCNGDEGKPGDPVPFNLIN